MVCNLLLEGFDCSVLNFIFEIAIREGAGAYSVEV